MLFSCHQPEIWFLEKLSSLINASTNMNSSLSKISQYCHNFLKSLISGLRQYLIWSGWTELAAADPRKVGSHLSLGEQVGGVWVGQSISIRVGHSHFSYSDVPNQTSKKSNEANGCNFGKHGIFGFSMCSTEIVCISIMSFSCLWLWWHQINIFAWASATPGQSDGFLTKSQTQF